MRTSRFSREHLRDLQRHRASHSGRLGTNVAQEQVPSERSCSGDLRGAVAGGDQSEPSHCATANAGVERPRIRPRHRGVEEEKRTSRARNSCPLRFTYQSSRTGKDHQSRNGERAVDLLRSVRRWALASPFGKSPVLPGRIENPSVQDAMALFALVRADRQQKSIYNQIANFVRVLRRVTIEQSIEDITSVDANDLLFRIHVVVFM